MRVCEIICVYPTGREIGLPAPQGDLIHSIDHIDHIIKLIFIKIFIEIILAVTYKYAVH